MGCIGSWSHQYLRSATSSWCNQLHWLVQGKQLLSVEQADRAVYLIFFAWDLVGLAIIYVWVVETKQLSLEDMDSVFDAPNPKKRSFELFAEAKERAKFEKEQDRQRREEGV